MEKIKINLHCRTWPGLPLALLLMVVALPSQAEFYKWTDESGQVHYTQTPPPEQQAEKITVDTGTAAPVAMTPTEKEGVKVCGSLILPARRLDPVTSVAMYRQAIALWQKYIDENGKKSDEASQQGVTDRRCAIAYANRELQALSEVEQGINTNYQDARDELDDLQQQVAACDEAEGSVAACKQQHQSRIQQLNKMLRTLEQRKKMIESGK
jgi:hypothetical protein